MGNARTTTGTLAGLLGAIALSACGAGPGALGSGAGIQSTHQEAGPSVVVGLTSDDPAGAYTSTTSFEIANTLEVRVVADWSGVAADGSERLQLRAPDGNVYYATSIPFTGATGSDRSVSVLDDGTLRTVYVLQVAGTPIEQYAMTGTWSVSVALDGADTSASVSFQLW